MPRDVQENFLRSYVVGGEKVCDAIRYVAGRFGDLPREEAEYGISPLEKSRLNELEAIPVYFKRDYRLLSPYLCPVFNVSLLYNLNPLSSIIILRDNT